MRILFIGPLPEPVTGQSLACRVILEGMPDHCRVDVVNLSKNELRQGLTSMRRVADVLKILCRIWQKQWSADVIYLTVSESFAGNVKDLVIFVLCFGRLDRMIIHLLGGESMREIMLGGRKYVRRLNVFFVRRLGGVIVEGETQVAIYRGAVRRDKIHTLPNFAEDVLFTTVDKIDKKFGCVKPLKVLFLSNLLPGKGHDELLDAFLTLDEKTKASVELDLAGRFESEEHKAVFLARIAGIGKIRYHGAVAGELKRSLFDQAHVLCLPTYYPYEGQPICIIEAYASGCAVITTTHSGIGDVFRDEVNGFEVVKRSVASLRLALGRAAAEPERLRRIATTNMQTALKHHRATKYQKAVVQIIQSVAGTI